MHLLAILCLLLSACAPWNQNRIKETMEAPTDSLQAEEQVVGPLTNGMLGARWHLWRAQEARTGGQFEQAQQDLDQAYRILAELASEEGAEEEIQKLASAIEQTYLALLPHLKYLSADSPLSLLLEGLSEEKIEALPPDATELVRIHQLSQRSDMPIDANAKVVASIHFFQTRGRATYMSWMKRAGRFRELILDILRQEGVPADLFFVAMIESGFNPHAYSRAHAVGLWQFIEETGRLQGLHQDYWVDERRDPIKSTRAAAKHFKDLYAEFQDWRLALAAYNAGRNRITRAIEQARSRVFWQLDLPRETENYVPLFMAAVAISKDPALWGFDPVEPDPPLAFDEVELSAHLPYIDLKTAAKILGINFTVLRDLNPELRHPFTPPLDGNRTSYRLRVPQGKGQGFLARYASLPPAQKLALHPYKVRRRDTLSTIARRFATDSRLLAEINHLRNPNRLYPGQILQIPMAATATAREKQVYRVRPGDTLSSIARRHGVSLEALKQWNKLKNDLIHPGDQLVIWASTSTPTPAAVSKTHPPSTPGKPKFHIVKKGETLWSLAQSLGVTVAELKEWNGLRDTSLQIGQRLIVSQPAAEGALLYTVVKGDTLYSIARRFGIQAQELARQNNIALSATLLAGTTLKIYPGNDN